MKLYFIRHGKTEFNEQGRLQGHADSALTIDGIKDSQNLAKFFLDKNITKIYVSPLQRVLETAKIISNKINKQVVVTNELKEICYGKWEKEFKSKLKLSYFWEMRNKNKYSFVHPGSFNNVEGQSYQQNYPLISSFLDKIKVEHSEDNIIILSHLGILRNARKYFENLSDEEAVNYTPTNEEIYFVEINNGDILTESFKK